MKKVYLLLVTVILVLCFQHANAQVLNPNDPSVKYNSANPPVTPPYDSIGKWVYTPDLGAWDTVYKAYYYKGMAFRLMFPKSWTPNTTKTYPMVIFLHGLGERGTIYDNDLQLKWEGQNFVNAQNSGAYDGFVLYPQSQNGFWGEPYYSQLISIINYMAQNVKLDINRVHLSGLSAGGSGDWAFLTSYPAHFASAEIISSAYTDLLNYINNPLKYVPIWLSQGGLDGNPSPYTAQTIVQALQNAGASITYTVYPTLGHGCWDAHYAEADTYPYFNRHNIVNPTVFYGKSLFCPADTSNISDTLGLSPGFDGYEWRKNGVVISGASSNILVVNQLGTYDARVKRGNTWSYWSPSPVVIGIMPPTQTPNIQTAGLMSTVLPSPDGDSVILSQPAGYASYQWNQVGNPNVLSTQQTLTVRTPGNYIAKVTQTGGCSSNPSQPFNVVNAGGPNPPDAATNLSGFASSQTQITLNWNNNPNPVHNETGFEIYRSTTSGGPYTLVAINPADSLKYIDNGLKANVTYFYVVRAIDSTAAAAPTPEVRLATQVDKIPPTAPGNLTVVSTTRNSVTLSWNQSTDNVSVANYFVYVNGAKSYITPDTTFTVFNLTHGQLYAFTVKAIDPTGNISPASNQVNAAAIISGLTYKYYTFTGTWNSMPDFNTLTPIKSGTATNVNLNMITQTTNFAVMWQGYINIPVSGTYTFGTSSDDGSNLYFNMPYSASATPTVNNDGVHAQVYKAGTPITLNAGAYPITITYYQQGGGYAMQVYWQSSALGLTNKTLIPDSAFADKFVNPGIPPAAPSNIKATAASFHQINLTWNDNSNNETGFEIYRATSFSGPYNIIATTSANTTSYSDTLLNPQTTYYYKIQSINQFGSSGFNGVDLGGLLYKYFTTGSQWNQLPDYNSLTPVSTGNSANVTLNPATQTTNFGFLWTGKIRIPVSGSYTFWTYSDDGSKLYIDTPYSLSANALVNNDGPHAMTYQSGTINLNAGLHNIAIAYYQAGGGYGMQVYWQSTALGLTNKTLIPDSAFSNPNMTATTLALPPIPAAPTNLAATAISPYKINLTWNDNSNNETEFDIYRSVGNNSNYIFLSSIGPNNSTQATYSDSALYANTTYYYHVQATGIGGKSAFTNEANSTTLDNPPVLENIGNQTMRYGTNLQVNVVASDPDGDKINLSTVNMPSFGSFEDYGDGTGLISFTPAVSNQGTFSNIQIIAKDQHGGVSTQTFNLVVNNNYPPVITYAPANLSLNTGATQSDTLLASDQNLTDSLSWSVQGLPSFASLTTLSNGKAVLGLQPSYSDAGTYNIVVTVSDQNGATSTKVIALTVNFVNPNTNWYINFSNGTLAGLPWNNVNSLSTSNLVNDQGATTNVGLSFQTTWWSTYNNGAVTGNNSGIYPDNVIKDYYYFGIFGGPNSVPVNITGLDPTKNYNLTFFASSVWNGVSDNGYTVYNSGNHTDSIYVQNNSQRTITFHNLTPDSTGTLLFTMSKGTNAPVGYINAMVISLNYDNKQPPISPRNFNIANYGNKGVEVAWSLPAHYNNASGFEIYRASTANGPFSLLNPNPSNGADSIYIDSTTNGNTTYFYSMRAVNNYGASGYTDTLNVTTLVNNPSITGIANVQLKYGSVDTIYFNASASSIDTITLSVGGLPAFGAFQDLGNGHGRIILTPQSGDIGQYNGVNVFAITNHGGKGTSAFNISIFDKNIRKIQLNFLNSGSVFTAPWNHIGGWGFAGTSLQNLADANNVQSNIGISLLDSWSGSFNAGYNTYNNSGVVPDSVLSTYFYQQDTSVKRLQITGLNPNAKYNFIFVGSSINGDNPVNYTTRYSIGNRAVSLNGYRNSNQYVQINGVTPNQNGQLVINVQKDPAASYGLLNALLIEEYTDTTSIMQPSNLTATAQSTASVQLKWVDNSYNETGYTVYRATSLTGNYTSVTTLPANTTQFLDGSVIQNTRYFYKVQATGNKGAVSIFSNVASVTTPQFSIYMNFNAREAAAPAPWNNTNHVPVDGATFRNLLDANGNPTGVTMTFVKNFENENNVGVVTGNNSGVYPDLVMQGEYYLDNGLDTVVLQVSNLNISDKYDFTFFGSLVGFGWDNNTLFLINNQMVGLNVANNATQTVQLTGIMPDSTGTITIRMINAYGCKFAILGAMVISQYTNYDSNGHPVYFTNPRIATEALLINNWQQSKNNTVKVYPNPFQDHVNVEFRADGSDGPITLQLYDMNGRLIKEKYMGNLSKGLYHTNFDVSDKKLSNGMYLLRISSENEKALKIIQLIRQQ